MWGSLAQADAHPLGQLALVEAGFGGDDVEDAQLRLFLGCHFFIRSSFERGFAGAGGGVQGGCLEHRDVFGLLG